METDSSKQQVVESPEEVAAYLSDMTLDEWRKATATEQCEQCPDSQGLGYWGNKRFVYDIPEWHSRGARGFSGRDSAKDQ